jgi:hypothetical protein
MASEGGWPVSVADLVLMLTMAPKVAQARAVAAAVAVLEGKAVKSEAGERAAAAVARRGDVARRLGVSLRTVDSLLASGALRRVRLPGRARGVGVLASSVDDVIERGLA